MQPELQKALADIINALKSGADQAAALGKEQLPILVREYLNWGLMSALFGVVVGVTMLAGGYKGARWASVKFDDCDDWDGRFGWGWAIAAGCLVSVAGFITTMVNAHTALEVLVAPRVYLLEQVAALVK